MTNDFTVQEEELAQWLKETWLTEWIDNEHTTQDAWLLTARELQNKMFFSHELMEKAWDEGNADVDKDKEIMFSFAVCCMDELKSHFLKDGEDK